MEVTSAERRAGEDDVTSGGSPAIGAGTTQSRGQPLDWAWIFKPVKGSAAMRQAWPPPPLLQQQYVSTAAAVPQALHYTPSPLGLQGVQRSAGAPHPPGLPSLGSGQHALAPSASVEAAVAAAAALETQLQPRSVPGPSQTPPAGTAAHPAGTAVNPSLSQAAQPSPAGPPATSCTQNPAASPAAGAAPPNAVPPAAPTMANGPVSSAAASPAAASQAVESGADGALPATDPAAVSGIVPSASAAQAEQPQASPAGTAAPAQLAPPEAEAKPASAAAAEPPVDGGIAGPSSAADAAMEGETEPETAAVAAPDTAGPPPAEAPAMVSVPPARGGSGGLEEQPSVSAVSEAAAAAANTPTGEQPSMSGTPPASGAVAGVQPPPRPSTAQEEDRPPLPASWQEWQVPTGTPSPWFTQPILYMAAARAITPLVVHGCVLAQIGMSRAKVAVRWRIQLKRVVCIFAVSQVALAAASGDDPAARARPDEELHRYTRAILEQPPPPHLLVPALFPGSYDDTLASVCLIRTSSVCLSTLDWATSVDGQSCGSVTTPTCEAGL